MNSILSWSEYPAELVLWAQVISLWCITSYAIAPDSIRERSADVRVPRRWFAIGAALVIAGVGGWLLPPSGTGIQARIIVAAILASLVGGTAIIRQRLIWSEKGRCFVSEFEIIANGVLILTSAAAISGGQIGPPQADCFLYSGKVTAILGLLGATVFAFRGGTYIVRGVLDKAGAIELPRGAGADVAAHPQINTIELNRGRSIGNLERFLMVAAIGVGSYQVLGFIIAAKGLIRSKEFNNRNFAEYFILGSLASAAVALSIGLILRACIPYFWHLPT